MNVVKFVLNNFIRSRREFHSLVKSMKIKARRSNCVSRIPFLVPKKYSRESRLPISNPGLLIGPKWKFPTYRQLIRTLVFPFCLPGLLLGPGFYSFAKQCYYQDLGLSLFSTRGTLGPGFYPFAKQCMLLLGPVFLHSTIPLYILLFTFSY